MNHGAGRATSGFIYKANKSLRRETTHRVGQQPAGAEERHEGQETNGMKPGERRGFASGATKAKPHANVHGDASKLVNCLRY